MYSYKMIGITNPVEGGNVRGLKRLFRPLLLIVISIIVVGLTLVLLIFGLLVFKDRRIQDDVAGARHVIQQGIPYDSTLAHTLTFLHAHPELTLPNHHFTQLYLNLPFKRTAGYDATDPNSQAYPQGKALLAGWTAASGGPATLDVVFFFDGRGRLARSTIKERTIDVP